MQQRRFSRFSTSEPVTFEIEGMVGQHKHLLNDASQGGLSFIASGYIKKGTHIEMSLDGNDSKTTAKVLWCTARDRNNYHLGLTFEENIDESVLHRLIQKKSSS